MDAGKLRRGIDDVERRLDGLHRLAAASPACAAEVLTDALAELRECVRGLHAAEADLYRRTDEQAAAGRLAGDQRQPYQDLITQHKRAEEEQRLAVWILRRLNESGRIDQTAGDILDMVKEHAGLDAVAIRLRHGEDFPFHWTRGFGDDFVESERSLVVCDAAGGAVRDEGGRAVLACMCGRVLAGAADPKDPLFTEAGSFWTNSTSELLGSGTIGEDGGLALRSRCNREGYESVALVPLRCEGEVIGLLHLADRERGRFTPERIGFFEKVGASIGIAVKRSQAEDALRAALADTGRRRAETDALLAASRAVLEHHDFAAAARAIFDSAKAFTGATAGYVALLTASGKANDVLFLDSGGSPCSVDPSLPMPVRGLRAEAYRTGRTVYDNDFARSPHMALMPAGHVALDNVLFAPLVLAGRPVGLLGLANKPGGFTEDDARLAGSLGEFAAIALKNSRAMESLEHSEQRFRTLARTATDAIICADAAGKITLWNSGAEAMFGHTEEEALGRPLTIIMPKGYRWAHSRALERLAAGGEPKLIGRTTELAGRRKDGSEFPLELSLASWRTAEGTFFTGIIRDITERKRAEEALYKARDELERRVKERTEELAGLVEELGEEVRRRIGVEEKLQLERRRLFGVLDVLPGYVALVARDHSIRFANHTYVELFGAPGAMPCYTVQRGLDKACPDCPVVKIFQTDGPREWEWTCPAGRAYRVWGYPFSDVDGSAVVLKLGIDVTERKELEKQVIETSETERRTIGRDLHDSLGQNLTGLALLTKGLARKLRGDSSKGAAIAEQIAELANQSVAQVRALARGLNPVGLEQEGLHSGLKELAVGVEEGFGISCHCRATGSAAGVEEFVATNLYRIAAEAVTNAVKHARAGNITIALTVGPRRIALAVRDDGVGLPDRADKRSGMGLRIMAYRAAAIGAALTVEPARLGGTVVRCTLERAPGPRPGGDRP